MLNTWELEATDSAVNEICATQEANDNHHFDESPLGRAASDISSKPTPTKFGTVKLPRSTFSSFSPFRCFDNPNYSVPIQESIIESRIAQDASAFLSVRVDSDSGGGFFALLLTFIHDNEQSAVLLSIGWNKSFPGMNWAHPDRPSIRSPNCLMSKSPPSKCSSGTREVKLRFQSLKSFSEHFQMKALRKFGRMQICLSTLKLSILESSEEKVLLDEVQVASFCAASPRSSMILAFSERPCVSPNVLSTLFLFENHPDVFRDDLQSQDMSSTGTVGELRVYRWARGGHLLIHDVFDGIATFH
ncbi:hypothetical protein NA56DRAFT_653802 [Hyaloscypha hepaticicola]|uniref:Uncharacterized protein n=1 Tax=Hyaloscypha hepaticicola TaxID=2082293 RepID=A0A2J6QP36_9HELO|nr:hypothetical protein NA56DRAFT_653802 [Hyaloscypha hepaticicola]